jgi:hypothetical protein
MIGQFDKLKDVGIGVAKSIAKAFADLVASKIFKAVAKFVDQGIGLFGGLNLLAEGGLVTKPIAGIVGEAGPEVVIPLKILEGIVTRTGIAIAKNLLPAALQETLATGALHLATIVAPEAVNSAIISAASVTGAQSAGNLASSAILGELLTGVTPGLLAGAGVKLAAELGIGQLNAKAGEVIGTLGNIGAAFLVGGPLAGSIALLVEAIMGSITDPSLARLSGALAGAGIGAFFGGPIGALLGGAAGSLIGGFFKEGTPFVPRDMLGVLHKGEAVIPAKRNPFGPGGEGDEGIVVHAPITIQGNFSNELDLDMVSQTIGGMLERRVSEALTRS